MTHEQAIKSLWLSITEISLPNAELRDEYLKLGGFREGMERFGQLNEAYSNLNSIEQTLFEYLEIKKPLLGSKPDREVVMIAKAAVDNAKVLFEVASGELNLLKGRAVE